MNNLAKKINDELKNTNEAKEFFKIKNAILNDKYLNDLLNTIKKTQNEMKDYLKNNQIVEYKKAKSYLEVLKDEFINNSLINNYIVSKNELESLLLQVVTIIGE